MIGEQLTRLSVVNVARCLLVACCFFDSLFDKRFLFLRVGPIQVLPVVETGDRVLLLPRHPSLMCWGGVRVDTSGEGDYGMQRPMHKDNVIRDLRESRMLEVKVKSMSHRPPQLQRQQQMS